jgi:hypothetical protein
LSTYPATFLLRDPYSVTITDADGNTLTLGNIVALAIAFGNGDAITVGDPDILADALECDNAATIANVLAGQDSYGPPAPEDLLPLIDWSQWEDPSPD